MGVDVHRASTRYGSSCNLVLSTGQGVNGYTLDAALGEFILTHPNVRSDFIFVLRPMLISLLSDHHPAKGQDLFLQ